MKKLTTLIGEPPFIFHGKQMQLTDGGKKLIPLVNQVLADYDKILALKSHHQITGDLRISVPESLMLYGSGPIFSQYVRDYPEVNLIINNATCLKNHERLLADQADIALMLWTPLRENKQLQIDDFGKQEFSLITSIDGPDTWGELMELDQKHFVINEKECGYRLAFEKFIQSKSIADIQTMEVWSLAAIKQTVIDGLGFSFLPDFVIQDELQNKLLKRIPVDIPTNLHIQLLSRNNWQNPAIKQMLENLSNIF
ncbi:hypothetical protein IV57_GL000411 [Companilactobacillus kimchiensis]|uniref:LysR substrate-binding domain-containing protein n=2 Tax=Companilactobacillus kimchiensis TaxID=993692 RepID=A0A0R2LBP3_9LACO|nr:hypothetical protein IV57_GL000411 [Companilactobacillus kimchiensis]